MVYPEAKKVKRFAIIAVLCLLAGCAVWQKLQIMAITSMLAVLGLAYRDYTRQIFDVGLKLLRGTTQAKFGSLELTLTELTDKVEKVEKATWVSIMLSQLSAEEVGLLVDVSKTKKYSPPDAVKSQLRKLRAKGLIKHDKPLLPILRGSGLRKPALSWRECLNHRKKGSMALCKVRIGQRRNYRAGMLPEWGETVIEPHLHPAARIPSQFCSAISRFSRSVWRTYSSRSGAWRWSFK